MLAISSVLLTIAQANGQANVVTAHNDAARTGQNLQETLLTRTNVDPATFGKLFSWNVGGVINAQPLYVSQVTVPGKGVHNVVYIATTADVVYAFDANNNGGVNALPLWQVSLLTNATTVGTYKVRDGVVGTPVIDLTSKTMYLVSSETKAGKSIFRLHGLDLTNGAEKFGGPVVMGGSIIGSGSASSGGVLTFDPAFHVQRPGLLLQNGVVYSAFGSVDDMGAWHGWIFSNRASTLTQIDLFCTTANGSGAGIWMSGAGLAGEVTTTAKPYGRLFVSTGNGTYSAAAPYKNSMSYGMSVLNLDLTGGKMAVADEFTPYNEAHLDSQDGDLGSGGPLLLPSQITASGNVLKSLVQVGKTGTIYILNRDSLGGFNPTTNKITQEVQTATSGQGWGAGIWGTEAYWNKSFYYGGTKPGTSSNLAAYSYTKGVLSSSPTSKTTELFSYPGPTPSISANGANNGIVWMLNHGSATLGPAILLAYDASDLGNLLYSSNSNLSRDLPGNYIKFTVPTVANGRVYVGTSGVVSVYGLLNSTPTVAPPVFSPAGATFTGSQAVTIKDSTAGAHIYYTLDGTIPTVASTPYTGPIRVTGNTTIAAIASATGYLQGKPVLATFSSTANAANPTFSLASGSYTGAQTLAIRDATGGAKIYYTVDGTAPTTSATLYAGPITVPVSEMVRAMATASGLLASSVVGADYTIEPVYGLNFSDGFASAVQLGQMQFNGSTALDDFRLQLTTGGQYQAGSAFYTKKLNVQAFTTDFTFQLSNPQADGITFTIQNQKATALGSSSAGMGYQFIPKSVAIKFDIFNNAGEGSNSIGLYTNGALPALPSVSLNGTGVDLRGGDYLDAHVTYDGRDLNLTLTDAVTLASVSHSWPLDIPAIVGGDTAWVGFTGSTGQSTASQKLTYWTYLEGRPIVPNFPLNFDSVGFYMTGTSRFLGTALQLTHGTQYGAGASYYSMPVNVKSFTTSFDFQVKPGLNGLLGDGFTFIVQNAGPHAIGGKGGGLGYAGIQQSVAIKFDLYNNSGEGANSTGVYVDGAGPTQPSINLTPMGLQLGNGDIIHVQIVYDGTTLTWTFHDLTHSHNATAQKVINIPHMVGSNTAYVGFTAASGGATANQRIFNWVYANP